MYIKIFSRYFLVIFIVQPINTFASDLNGGSCSVGVQWCPVPNPEPTLTERILNKKSDIRPLDDVDVGAIPGTDEGVPPERAVEEATPPKVRGAAAARRTPSKPPRKARPKARDSETADRPPEESSDEELVRDSEASEESDSEVGSTNPSSDEGSSRQYADSQVADLEMLRIQVDECKQKRKQADFCCGSGAMGCLIGAKPDDDLAAVASMGGVLVQALIAGRQMQGMQQNCETQEGLANFSAGLNAATAVRCQFSRSSCNSTCETLKEQIHTAQLRECGVNPTATCERPFEIMKSEIQAQVSSCERLMANMVSMGAQAATTYFTTKQMAELCQEVIAASPPPVAPGIPGNDLCSDPSDLSNPYCRQQFCSQPGTANLPECQNNSLVSNKPGGSSGSSGFSSLGGGGGSVYDADLGGADLGDGQQQLPGTQTVEIGDRRISQTQPGLGGGLPPGGGGGGGGDSGYGTASGGQRGLNTNILNGLSSGSGYSVASGGLQGGGGYSNPVGNAKKDDKNKPFDLKQFLPKKPPPQRKLAGLTGPKDSLEGQLAGKHENIFTRVSNKYKEMCILDRLICPTRK